MEGDGSHQLFLPGDATLQPRIDLRAEKHGKRGRKGTATLLGLDWRETKERAGCRSTGHGKPGQNIHSRSAGLERKASLGQDFHQEQEEVRRALNP